MPVIAGEPYHGPIHAGAPLMPRPPDRSPMTDLRALGASAAFHLSLFALVSLVALRVAVPTASSDGPMPVTAELSPVENRAPDDKGGGSPGELGGASEVVRISAESRAARGLAARKDAAADGLLADALPDTTVPDSMEKAPIGPATTGLGLVEGEGYGGGGGSGGGSGGGVGKGLGPGTEFFGAQDRASSFAYVIDCSGSMSNRNALRIAKAELLNSLDRLPPDARFTVVFYNIRPTVFPDERGNAALMAATAENKARVRTRLTTIRPDGGTDHAKALQSAFMMKPEVVFFLTDAERMDPGEARTLRDEAGAIRIQAIEFGEGPEIGGSTPLRDLATATGGTFRHVDLSVWNADGLNGAPATRGAGGKAGR